MSTSPTLDASGLTVLRTADVLDNLGEAIQGSDQFGPEEPELGQVEIGAGGRGEGAEPVADLVGEGLDRVDLLSPRQPSPAPVTSQPCQMPPKSSHAYGTIAPS